MTTPHKPVKGEKSLGQVAIDKAKEIFNRPAWGRRIPHALPPIWFDSQWEEIAQAVASHTLATSPSVKGLVDALRKMTDAAVESQWHNPAQKPV